jgi:hypothetical protein
VELPELPTRSKLPEGDCGGGESRAAILGTHMGWAGFLLLEPNPSWVEPHLYPT